ncbi:MAG TPA: phosphatidylserine decarboxylase [Candidatus Binataceae bacterium]|jgi:phosphatidylserine decarboxylase|nr:phosphatidylserine decarboxylase [Candidatus Binataceae bacterium]
MALRAGDLARRVGGTIGIAAEGVKMAAVALAAGALALVLGWHGAGVLMILCGLAIAAFFRDPERSPVSASERLVLSGADGNVSDVAEMPLPDGAAGERYHRVSVFMSPLNVHVNRAPVGGEIISVRHTPGAFHAAFRDHASEHNERNLIVLSDARGRQHAMVQIAGYLARRIVCRLHPHDTVRCGERIGLIMFGSRVDHFIPPDYRVVVKTGEKVRAGESIIAELLQ